MHDEKEDGGPGGGGEGRGGGGGCPDAEDGIGGSVFIRNSYFVQYRYYM